MISVMLKIGQTAKLESTTNKFLIYTKKTPFSNVTIVIEPSSKKVSKSTSNTVKNKSKERV
jgi:hypothetical protein